MARKQDEMTAANGPVIEHYKVTIGVGPTRIYVLSKIEPVITRNDDGIMHVELDVISGTEHGDTIGFIRWPAITSISWRKA